MDRNAATGEHRERDDRDGPTERRFRLVPPAITPLTFGDLAAGVLGELQGHGRTQFRGDVRSFLGAEGIATYTSFRRALAGCFNELAATGDGTEVLIPAFCSSDFPDAIEGVGLDPVRYDVDPLTMAADLHEVEAALSSDTLAVVAVNVLGYSSPMADLADQCSHRDVALIEALGYAFGAEYRGKRLGTFGDCAVLNFQQGKPIPVGGGMVASQDPEIDVGDGGRPAVDPNLAALAGYTSLSRPRPYYAYTKLKKVLDGVDGFGERATTHPEAKFDVEYAPPFATISNFQGTVAHRLFGRLDQHRRRRARTAEWYVDELATCSGVDVPVPVSGLTKHQYVRFPLLAETEALRDRIQAALRAAGVQATTLYDWPVLDPDEYPGAARLQRRIVTLPTHPYIDDQDRRLIVDVIRDTVRGESP